MCFFLTPENLLQVFGIFSITGEEHPQGLNPFNTLIMIDDKGEIKLTYRKIFPWTPKEPWTAGHETAVAVGPKGLIIGASICYDMNMPELVRDTVFKGAELMVRIQGESEDLCSDTLMSMSFFILFHPPTPLSHVKGTCIPPKNSREWLQL